MLAFKILRLNAINRQANRMKVNRTRYPRAPGTYKKLIYK